MSWRIKYCFARVVIESTRQNATGSSSSHIFTGLPSFSEESVSVTMNASEAYVDKSTVERTLTHDFHTPMSFFDAIRMY